jgi:exosortase/archaeosortase family protein
MATTDHAALRPRTRQQQRHTAGTIGRVVLAGAILALAGIAVIENQLVRSWDALGASGLLHLVGYDSMARSRYFLIWDTPTKLSAYEVTAECTALVLLVPMLIVATAIAIQRRASVPRLVAGIAAMVGTVAVVNEVRLAFIGYAATEWGSTGYTIAHTFVGSAIGLLGFAGGLALFFVIATKRRRG